MYRLRAPSSAKDARARIRSPYSWVNKRPRGAIVPCSRVRAVFIRVRACRSPTNYAFLLVRRELRFQTVPSFRRRWTSNRGKRSRSLMFIACCLLPWRGVRISKPLVRGAFAKVPRQRTCHWRKSPGAPLDNRYVCMNPFNTHQCTPRAGFSSANTLVSPRVRAQEGVKERKRAGEMKMQREAALWRGQRTPPKQWRQPPHSTLDEETLC